jgi:pimeloyl-ACP methyl ester carboxylesterase
LIKRRSLLGAGVLLFGSKEVPLNEHWYESAHTKLFATESGHGRPLVFLHGGLSNHQGARLYVGPLEGRCRLITPDLRGSGRSYFAGELSWEVLADDLAALLHHLGLPRAAIGGVSFGAGVAVAFALRHPALVEALAIISPAFGGGELGLLPAQRAAMDAMDAAGQRTLTEGMAALFPLFDTLPAEVRERARPVVAGYDPASVATSTRFMATCPQPFARGADLAAITAPVLLVPGTDPTHPPEVAAVYVHHLPRCTTGTLDELLAPQDW